MDNKRLKEILRNAICAYESELEEQDYDSAEELHRVVLHELGMTEREYIAVMEFPYSW